MSDLQSSTPSGESPDAVAAAAQTLQSSAAKVNELASVVGSCIGPGALTVAIEDRAGESLLTSHGATIATALCDGAPAADAIATAAAAQAAGVGDGTCALILMAAGMVAEGARHAADGAVRRELAGAIRTSASAVSTWLRGLTRALEGCEDPLLLQVALSAAGGDEDLARLCLDAVKIAGQDRQTDAETFRPAGCVIAHEGWTDRMVGGVVVRGKKLSALMPSHVGKPELLLIDGDLQAHEIVREAMASEVGIRLQAQYRDEFFEQLRRVPALGVGCLVVSGRVSPAAEEQLAEAGVLAIADVGPRAIVELARHTAATAIKPLGLRKTVGELRGHLGSAQQVSDNGEGIVVIEGGRGRPAAALLLGGTTPALATERGRLARSILASTQSALHEGVLPGGGAAQLNAAERLRAQVAPQASAGAECLRHGLRAPAVQVAANCGKYDAGVFAAVERAHSESETGCWGVDARSGQVVDMYEAGVVDAAEVVIRGIAAAADVAAAILTIGRAVNRQPE